MIFRDLSCLQPQTAFNCSDKDFLLNSHKADSLIPAAALIILSRASGSGSELTHVF